MLDDLALFVSIVEAGSLSAAAARHELPPATVTRRLQALEQKLGHRLLTRCSRLMELTAEGQQYFEQCRPLVHALRQATQQLDGMLRTVSGNIRILAPANLASGPLSAAWSSFVEKYPGVTLELDLATPLQGLAESGSDLAIREGELMDSSLTQRRLASTDMVLVAAPSYLRRAGVPARAQDLAAHACVVAEPLRQWRFADGDKGEFLFQPAARVRVNDMRLAVSMAADGMGILYCPRLQCRAELDAGQVTEVLANVTGQPHHIYAVWSQQRYLPARVRALVEHLAAHMASHPV